MTRAIVRLIASMALSSAVEAFSVVKPTVQISISEARSVRRFVDKQGDNTAHDEGESPRLILDGVQEHMSKLKGKYPTAEADYLAAARKRAEQKVESRNDMSTDDDWRKVAEEKKERLGDDEDDWEASVKEAGNADSQILIPVEPSSGEGGEDDEPKLLLL